MATTLYMPGSVSTQTGGAGGAGSLLDQFVARRMREFEADRAKTRAAAPAASPFGRRSASTSVQAMAPAREPTRRRIEMDVPWYSAQGAATRPVGLGAQQIPGMAVDPRLLPPHMRPGASGFSGAGAADDDQRKKAAGEDWDRYKGEVAQRRAIDSTGGYMGSR